jgi:hypothetical protein
LPWDQFERPILDGNAYRFRQMRRLEQWRIAVG